MADLLLTPLDTLFFRDGRAFSQDETRGAVTRPVFPPSPATVMGALRAYVAKQMGWNGRGNWSEDIVDRLGNGTDWTYLYPGRLRLTGPVVTFRGCPLWPAPLTLLQPKEKEETLLHLVPGAGYQTDLGMVCLPEVQGDPEAAAGAKPVERAWLAPADFQAALAGKTVSGTQLVTENQLWQQELRMGIARDPDLRTVEEGMLFATPHIRPRDGLSLAVRLEGLDGDEIMPGQISLGGEARVAELSSQEGLTDLPPSPPLAVDPATQSVKATVTLLTPLVPERQAVPSPGEALEDLPGTIVSACVAKAAPIGGWDSLNRRPLPLLPLLPAGSTWFLEVSPEEARTLERRHGSSIGRATAWGFGRIAIGCWPEEK